MDELVAKYAAVLQEIYDKRTAGDHTFSGVLYTLFDEMNQNCDLVEAFRDIHMQVHCKDMGL